MTAIMTDAAAIGAVRRVNCGYCWAGPGDACGLIPEGDHFARWARARRKGLVTAEQVGAALDTLTVVHDGALVVTEALSPAAALGKLGAVWSDDFDAYADGELDISQVHCALCQCAPCRCPEFGTPEYFALIDFRHGRGGAK